MHLSNNLWLWLGQKNWFTHGWDGDKIGKDDQEDDEGVVVPEVTNSLYV